MKQPKTTDRETSALLCSVLLDAGYSFETYIKYNNGESKPEKVNRDAWRRITNLFQNAPFWNNLLPAFMMEELWDILPIYTNGDRLFKTKNDVGITHVGYKTFSGITKINFYSKKPCNALARLVIWCVKNNHSLNLEKQ